MKMKGTFVQTTLYGISRLNIIVETGVIGLDSEPRGFQPPNFAEIPLAFCSYICEGYPRAYGERCGIAFETDLPIIYACPADTFELLRGGNWLPGHEQFLFSSLEEMLKKYPTSMDFKIAFQEYFKSLSPKQVYSNNDHEFARLKYNIDYCLRDSWMPGCNEITFQKPLKVKNCRIFNSASELLTF